jgi:hypothetical protein
MTLDITTVSKKTMGMMLLLACIAMPIFLLACQHTAPSFEVISLDIMPPKITVGERTTIRAELRNGNASVRTYNVPLMVNGVAQDRRTVMLTPGTTEVIEFSLVKHKAGSYKIGIGDRSSILEVQAPLPPAFQLSGLKISPPVTNLGEKIVITANIANTGGTQGSYTAELKIDDCPIKKEQVTMAAGADSTLNFTVCVDSPGTYIVTLGEISGQFVVIEPAQPMPPNNSTPSTTPSTPPTPGPCRTRS